MVRPTFARVDLGAIRHNVTAISEVIAPARFCAVVKADGYGHGDVPVASTALDAGADSVAVALVEEGARLREAGVSAPILLLSEPTPDSAHDVVKWDLTPTVYSEPFIDALAATGASMGVHLKVDTGMHRVGADPGVISDLVTRVRSHHGLRLESVWSHFAVAEDDPEFTLRQLDILQAAAAGLGADVTRHIANTAGALLFPQARLDMCRVGLGIYGFHPSAETRDIVELRPAMSLVTHVTHVRRLEAAARPSYGRIKALESDSTVVTVPVGYADGMTRGMSQNGSALINGRRYPLAGTVTMDQVMVTVGDDDVAIGDEVVLLGRQGDEEITAYEWAEELGTIPHEIVCSKGPRVPRRYIS